MLKQLFGLDDPAGGAAIAPEGQACLAGGPGTGRTRTLIAHAVHLLTRGNRYEDLALITPNDRLVEVTRDRLSDVPHRFDEQKLWLDGDAFELDLLEKATRYAPRIYVGTPAQYVCRMVRQTIEAPLSLLSHHDEIEILNSLAKRPGFPVKMSSKEIQQFHDWFVAKLVRPAAAPDLPVPHRHWLDLEQRYTEEMTASNAYGLHMLLMLATSRRPSLK